MLIYIDAINKLINWSRSDFIINGPWPYGFSSNLCNIKKVELCLGI